MSNLEERIEQARNKVGETVEIVKKKVEHAYMYTGIVIEEKIRGIHNRYNPRWQRFKERKTKELRDYYRRRR